MKKALFISSITPSTAGFGTSRRAVTVLKALSSRYEIHLLLPQRDSIPLACPVPIAACRYGNESPEGKAATTPRENHHYLRSHYAGETFDLVFVFRLESLVLSQFHLMRPVPLWLDLDELDSKRYARQAELQELLGRDREAAREWRRSKMMLVLENQKTAGFHRVLVCSEQERENFLRVHPQADCRIFLNTYPETASLPPRPDSNPFVFLFLGSLTYLPNEDAILFFALRVFPKIRQASSRPVIFRVIGIGHNPRLECLRYLECVDYQGYLPDVRPAYASSDALVVPLRAGAGTRIKILEAFAHGRPVISTALGAEGLDVRDGRELLLREMPDDFAQGCLELMENPALRHSLVETGRNFFLTRHHEDAVIAGLAATL